MLKYHDYVKIHCTICQPVKCSCNMQAQSVVQGRYSFKLLAVDVPTAAGVEQRLFVDGDDKLYTRGGVMSELQDPFLRVSCVLLELIDHQEPRYLCWGPTGLFIAQICGVCGLPCDTTALPCRPSPCNIPMKLKMKLMKPQTRQLQLKKNVPSRPCKYHQCQNHMMVGCTFHREWPTRHAGWHPGYEDNNPHDQQRQLQPLAGIHAAKQYRILSAAGILTTDLIILPVKNA